ncbi:hypothetical protein FHW23_000188 [Curtobacterium pusillum]|uniref:Uncharacterized protein n=1 Tax=Curtobacterium pusillum TaxID=69373 RepID=A0AAW3T0K3_9MICO|nr:hypothetical protein [Curtobacterium pusillum]MBA8988956.1 hypothetical protein [Curtobacterium pusillum]
MTEHKWAPPEHQDVPIYAAESVPLESIGYPEPIDPPQPVSVHGLRFEHIDVLSTVKAFAVARSDVAVYVEIAWQGRMQRAWVPCDTVTTRKLAPRRDRWTLGPAYSLPETARGGVEVDLPEPDPVLAWLQFSDRILEVEARVIAYTQRAVLIEWGFGQATDCAWILRDAVRPPEPSVATGTMST